MDRQDDVGIASRRGRVLRIPPNDRTTVPAYPDAPVARAGRAGQGIRRPKGVTGSVARWASAVAVLLATLSPIVSLPRPALAVDGVGDAFPRPRLVDPISISIGTGTDALRLNDGRDYIIDLPNAKKTGTLEIRGGRNVVVVGGYISVSRDVPNLIVWDGADAQAGRIVHIEGLLIDGSSGGHADGIKIKAPKAIVQIVMTRIVGLRGTSGGVHADVIQPFGGFKELRIDGLTASSRYNNLYLRRENDPLGPPMGKVTILNTNVFGYNNPSGWTPSSTLRGISFGTQPSDPSNDGAAINCALTAPMAFTRFYVDPPAGTRLGQFVYPHDRMQEAGCPAKVSSDGESVSWPALSDQVSGVVRLGPPPGGDFVPAAITGLRYRG